MDKRNNLNMAALPKELVLILNILKMANKLDKKSFEDIDWNFFIELARHHRIYPTLYPLLNQVEEGTVPLNVIQTLSHFYRKNTFHMLSLTAEMEEFSRVCHDHNIPLLILKGPVLASELYGDLSLRTCGDLDVLVPFNQLKKVDNLLVDMGYEKDDYFDTVLSDWTWRHHHFTYYHARRKVKLEIHWRLNPGPGTEPGFQELWERKRQSNHTNAPVFILGKEDLFLFLVSHGSRHGWSRLRWLLDIHYILKQDLDWRILAKLLRENHYTHIGGQAIYLSAGLFDSSLLRESKKLVGKRSINLAKSAMFYLERIVNLHTEPVPLEISNYHKRHLFHLMSYQQRTLFILSYLYPYPEDVEILPLPKFFHFLYFPLRPVLWAWRKSRRPAVSRGI